MLVSEGIDTSVTCSPEFKQRLEVTPMAKESAAEKVKELLAKQGGEEGKKEEGKKEEGKKEEGKKEEGKK